MKNNVNLKEIKVFTYETILDTFKEKVCTLQSYRNFVEYDNSYLIRKDECANVVLETNDINIKSNTETELNYDLIIILGGWFCLVYTSFMNYLIYSKI